MPRISVPSITNRLKRSVAAAICHPWIGRLLASTLDNRIPAYDLVIDTKSAHITSSVKAMLFWGLYERSESRFIRKYLRKDLDVIELGSSLGIISCQIRKTISSTRRLICVEANPSLIEIIDRNLSLNCPNTNIVIVNKAVDYDSSQSDTALLSLGDDTLGAHVSATHKAGCMQVETTTLSDLVTGAGMESLTLVSDIEGSEAGIVFKDAPALQKCKQLIIELHETDFEGQRVTVSELRDSLVREHGFTLLAAHGPVCVFER